MNVLDLFCGVGGAGMGYSLAGHRVIGVDIHPQPNYPFPFIRADALDYLSGRLNPDVIHCSPPCQRWNPLTISWGREDTHPDLIGLVRAGLRAWGGTYVIENIPQAPLLNPLSLCGVMFGLGVFRHRSFELSFPYTQPSHPRHTGRIGDGRYVTVTGHTGGSSIRDGWKGAGLDARRTAMGMHWATNRELTQAIPPAYTQYVGRILPPRGAE